MVNTQSCLCQDSCHMKEALSSVENVAEIREMWKGPSLLFATLYPLDPGFTDVKRKKLWSNKFKERFLDSRTWRHFHFECAARLFKRGMSMQCLPDLSMGF